jgi:hypothetical protein
MNIKQTTEKEITWAELKAMAEAGAGHGGLGLSDEITMTLEGGETATVVVGAFLEATEDKPAGVRFMFKDALDEPHQMNKEWTNKGGYQASEGRRHVLEEILPRLPADLRAVIRPRKITEIAQGKTLVYEDPLWMPSETDIFGRGKESWQRGAADGPEDFQLPIFTTERDRVKQRKDYGTTPYWCRSVRASSTDYFCLVGTDGSAITTNAYYSYGVAPGFDL